MRARADPRSHLHKHRELGRVESMAAHAFEEAPGVPVDVDLVEPEVVGAERQIGEVPLRRGHRRRVREDLERGAVQLATRGEQRERARQRGDDSGGQSSKTKDRGGHCVDTSRSGFARLPEASPGSRLRQVNNPIPAARRSPHDHSGQHAVNPGPDPAPSPDGALCGRASGGTISAQCSLRSAGQARLEVRDHDSTQPARPIGGRAGPGPWRFVAICGWR